MEKWTTQNCTFSVESFTKNRVLLISVQRSLRQQFGINERGAVPPRHTTDNLKVYPAF